MAAIRFFMCVVLAAGVLLQYYRKDSEFCAVEHKISVFVAAATGFYSSSSLATASAAILYA